MRELFFIHITDVHITDREKAWGTLGDEGRVLLRASIDRFNAMPDLDFVLITGDVLDLATPGEVRTFRAELDRLEKPWHFVPGNHDGFYDPGHPEACAPHEAIPLLDSRMADPVPAAQAARWSRTVGPGLQLIGLDSRMADHWNGVIEPEQFAWLEGELALHREALVMIAVHHPLHDLGPHNTHGWWRNFIVDNGVEVEALLDRFPNVRLVLAGHHHANHIRHSGARLQINTAALTGYPCEYRTVRLRETQEGWHILTDLHSAADPETLVLAHRLLASSDIAERYDAADPERWVQLCVGAPAHRRFEGLLP